MTLTTLSLGDARSKAGSSFSTAVRGAHVSLADDNFDGAGFL